MNVHKKIVDKLSEAANAYREAAQEEMNSGYGGSVYNVYHFMKECIALDGKARRHANAHPTAKEAY